ncbi:fam-m protein [Plasmodium brasilianum]|nr:fam-m protein [Plasmodium brasilianum]
MEQNIKLLYFFLIATFVFLAWICNFYHDVSTFNKYLDYNCSDGIELFTRNYRILAKYKQYKDSYIVRLKQDILKNIESEEKILYNNEKGNNEKNPQFNRSSLNREGLYTQTKDKNDEIFDSKHLNFEQKLIKKSISDFLEKRRTRNIISKKIKYKSYEFGVGLFFISLLLAIGFPILHGCQVFEIAWAWLKSLGPLGSFCNVIKDFLGLTQFNFFPIAYTVILMLLSAIFIMVAPNIFKEDGSINKLSLGVNKMNYK